MRSVALLLAVAGLGGAQAPEIRSGGVVNAASRIPSVLPSGAIARGARFDILGVRLGNATESTTVTLASGTVSLRVPLMTVSPRRIEARLPAEAPLGEVSLTVAVNGVASPPSAMRVVRAGFGIFSRNGEGWGPGKVDNLVAGGARSANGLRSAALPGQSLVLTGTGLGPSPPEVWVGPRRAMVVSVRHGAGGSPDEIRFRLARGSPSGCFVPLQVRQAEAAPSNTVTVAIHEGGGVCQPSEPLALVAWPGKTIGLVVLSRSVKRSGGTLDEGMAAFDRNESDDEALSPALLIPPLGSCATYSGSAVSAQELPASAADALTASPRAVGRDAGRRITVARGNRLLPVSPAPGAIGIYRKVLGEQQEGRPSRSGPLFFTPGDVVVGGEGGADIGAFRLSIPPPVPFVWDDRSELDAVDRAKGIVLHWRPLPPGGAVLIGLTAVDVSGAAWGACYCSAAPESGSFAIPPEMLANLPATHPAPTIPAPSLWISYLPRGNVREFQASGLDRGLAMSLFVQLAAVQLR